jgi:DNA polymerase elongation subunit (family B)
VKIVYAHTDSLYCPVDSIEEAQSLCSTLNEKVREIFPNLMDLAEHPVTLEFEKFYSSLGVGCVKNRNAGYISWRDGEYLDEPEFIVTGFSMKRISENSLAKQVQRNILEMWVTGCSENEVFSYVNKIKREILDGNIELDKLVKRGRVRRPWKEYKTFAGGIVGALYYNEYINPDDPITDSFLFVKVKNLPNRLRLPSGREVAPTYFSVEEMKEFPESLTIDYEYYANEVIRKARPIFDAMEWDLNKDANQTLLTGWL